MRCCCGAVLGTLCIVAGLAAVFLDVKPLVFRSGSMSPAIETGALGLARPVSAGQIEVGDIISVANTEAVRVTHRVIEIDDDDAGVLLQLQGDANAVPDLETYPVTSADRVFTSVPYAGYLVAWASSPVGVFAGGVLAGALLLIAFRPGARRARDPGPEEPGPSHSSAVAGRGSRPARRASRAGRVGALGGVLILAMGGYGVVAPSEPTMANWTDQATASSGVFAGQTIAPPESNTCSNEGGIIGLLGYVELTWPHVDARYAYRAVPLRASNGQPVGDPIDVPNPGTDATTVTTEIDSDLLDLGLLRRNINLQVYAYLPGTDWESATPHTVEIHTFAVVLGLSVSCGHL